MRPSISSRRGRSVCFGSLLRHEPSVDVGLPIHAPSRALNIVMRKVSAGDENAPMFGLAAAPEMVIAVPSEMPRWPELGLAP